MIDGVESIGDIYTNLETYLRSMTPEQQRAAGDLILGAAESISLVEATGLLLEKGSITRGPAMLNILIYILAAAGAKFLDADFTFYVSSTLVAMYTAIAIKGPSRSHKALLTRVQEKRAE